MAWTDAAELEREVRRVASALWGEPGSAQAQTIDGRERDCIYIGDDLIHYVECTVSRTLKKIQSDSAKMVKFRESESRRGTPVKLWIVTGDSPTSDQVSEARKHRIAILSAHEFRLRLFNGDEYISNRHKHRWGSATNPVNDSTDISSLKYQQSSLTKRDTARCNSLAELVGDLRSSKAVTVLGDFGMGKSMLVREVFTTFAKTYQKESRTAWVPVAINLRDHWGQSDPHEVLTRHAKKVGLLAPEKLIRAYNAGSVMLLLDGFDEIVGTPVAAQRELRRLRFDALQVVRQFVSDSRGKSGVMLAGRQNFFDSDRERLSALGTTEQDPVYELSEFSTDDALKLLESFKVTTPIPNWIPKRPLFLAYLASRGLLSEVPFDSELGAADAWEHLISAICSREKKINEYLDATALRSILEYLADMTRVTSNGMGPIRPSDVRTAFSAATGYDEPDEHMQPLLMRLPGLSSRNSEDGSREFLDESMLNALRASRLFDFVQNPYQRNLEARQWRHGVSELGLDIAANKIGQAQGAVTKCIIAAKSAIERWGAPTLAADLVRLAQNTADTLEMISCDGLCITGGTFEQLDLSECALNDLMIDNCEIKRLVAPSCAPTELRIRDCIVWKIEGVTRRELLPEWMINCDVEEYDHAPTNASIVCDEALTIGHRVLLTVLRKLYLQRGAGRRENALSRGLPLKYKEKVPIVLEIMRSAELCERVTLRGYDVWYPDRSRTGEVHSILNDYARSKHAVVVRARGV